MLREYGAGGAVLVDERIVDEFCEILEDGSDRASVPVVLPKARVRVMFVGPFLFETAVLRKAQVWKERLETEYGIEIEMSVAEPPFTVDSELDVKGYWIKPDARDYSARVKKLKSQVSLALVLSLIHI